MYNLTATISDHLPQFPTISKFLAISQAINIIFPKWTGQNLANKTLLNYFSDDWEDLLKIDKLDVVRYLTMHL